MVSQLFVGRFKPCRARFEPVRNDIIKPRGGLWTSSFDPVVGSAWVQWCRDNQFGADKYKSGWILSPASNVRIFEIDGLDDLVSLVACYPAEGNYATAPIDFELMGYDFDGLHLTDRGQVETRLSIPYNLYGWDCESTFWFRWAFSKVRKYGEVMGYQLQWS